MQEREFRVVAATPKAEAGEGHPRRNGDRGPRAGAPERRAGPSPAAGRLPVDLRRGEPPAESGARGRQLVDLGSSDRAADARSTWDSLGEPPAESHARGRRPVDPPGGPTETRESRRDPEVGLVCVCVWGGAHPAVCWSTRAEERGGRTREGRNPGWVAAPRARADTPGTGAGGPREPPLGAAAASAVPHPRSPGPGPGPGRTGHPGGERGGGGNRRSGARRPTGGARAPPPPPPPPAAGGRPGGRRKVDGRTDGRTAPEARAPPAGPRQTLVSRADFQ